jgi:hypothetical protein
MKHKYSIVVNSLILYVIAFLLTTILHEIAHALAGLLFSSQPVLHHNYVEHLSWNDLSVQPQVYIALSGPLFSLIQGLVAGFVYFESTKKRPFDLFMLWFSILGMFNFLGYLMTGPLFHEGDIGKALVLLNAPVWFQILIALVGAVLLLFIAYKLTRPFLNFSYKKEWVKSGKYRKNFSFHILILPWLVGSAVITILYLPIVAVVSIIYPFTSGMVFIFPWQNARRIKNVQLSDKKRLGGYFIFSNTLLSYIGIGI